MDIFILICNITIPTIMFAIGLLYTISPSKKINSILDLITPIVMMFSGVSDTPKTNITKNTNTFIVANKNCGVIWICSGLFILIVNTILLILNDSEINSISNSLFEFECLIFVSIFVTVEYLLKRKFYKKSN
ncbi:hypothetical protein [Clostridium weizhouense]|uniref:Uncharacterized protein n=1 Tax=Clostridium weizhouense TaxID=2859781 RepID=A0ABS7ARF0_9CLOT|nr:hypothetical protein [Clostridium weizhouense]MBW6410981.1 hypothetical protein [Clostridium weizhouense]